MITEFILDVFLFIPKLLIGILPTISLTLPADLVFSISSFTYGVAYFFPLGFAIVLITARYVLIGLKILLNIVYTVKSFIPTLGR